MLKRDYKRAFVISDTHLGVRNSSVEWMEMVREYFFEFFIPLLKREGRPGDFVLHCGDVFDSRHSLNLLIMNEAVEIFESISEVMPVEILIGNHDIFRKNTNKVNSSKVFKWMPNVIVHEEPDVLELPTSRLLLMPWRNSVEAEAACIDSHFADYLFCHTDVKGIMYNKFTEIEHGLDIGSMEGFKKVYSGHIHYSQHFKNFRMVGCPYQLTRSDSNNEKGIWLVDFENDTEQFFPNHFSPKFVKVPFEKVLEMTLEEVNEFCRNNFVDMLVNPKWSLNFPFSSFAEEITGYKRLDFIPRTSELDDNGQPVDENVSSLENFDVITLAERVINGTSHSDELKETLKRSLKKLYETVIKNNTEDYSNR